MVCHLTELGRANEIIYVLSTNRSANEVADTLMLVISAAGKKLRSICTWTFSELGLSGLEHRFKRIYQFHNTYNIK